MKLLDRGVDHGRAVVGCWSVGFPPSQAEVYAEHLELREVEERYLDRGPEAVASKKSGATLDQNPIRMDPVFETIGTT